jgi:adenylate kinase family enzyme
VLVVGSSGSGKTTTARRIAGVLGVPHIELDALHWGPDWTAASADELRERVQLAITTDAWVVDGNYRGKIGTMVWDRADTVVWVNPSRPVAMWRSLSRTIRRVFTGQELWNGNRENWRGLLVWRGEESVVGWAWTSYPRTRDLYESAMNDPGNRHLDFHRLRTSREVDRMVESLRSGR